MTSLQFVKIKFLIGVHVRVSASEIKSLCQ